MSGSDSLDELFGEGEGQPEPRVGTAIALLVSGLLLAIVGLACSSVPGGLLVLMAWAVVEKDLDRVESGFLPPEVKPRLLLLHRLTGIAIFWVVVVFCLQLYLLCNGTYRLLWSGILRMLAGSG